MKRILIISVALLMALLPTVALADNDVKVDVHVGRDHITVGDVIPLQIAVTHPQGWRVAFPKLDTQWGDLEIRKQDAPTITANADGTETTTTEIDVTAFRPGSATTPELNLTLADAQGAVQNVYAAPVTLQVQSVLKADDQTLRDIKAQAELWQLTSSPLPFAGSVVLAAGILIGAAALAWKHRPPQDKRTPRERALDELKELDALALDEKMNVKFLSVRVSEILRAYLVDGCGISARDLTTGELAQELKTRGVPPEIAAQMIAALRVCDDVKFANDISDKQAIQNLTPLTRQIVTAYPQVQAPAQRGSRILQGVQP
ncbi:MAG: hypothetical protein HDKAJFGB_01305 [Anaerolineae bacterium]|nr:hypothetical protein [Anaerolineae bacterium]RIK29650.1 MAG: hypothetical protein DCC52_07105 [Chloroflexota bacterium]